MRKALKTSESVKFFQPAMSQILVLASLTWRLLLSSYQFHTVVTFRLPRTSSGRFHDALRAAIVQPEAYAAWMEKWETKIFSLQYLNFFHYQLGTKHKGFSYVAVDDKIGSLSELKQRRRRQQRKRLLKMWLRVSASIFQLFKLIMLEKCVLTILELNWNQRLGHTTK